MTETQEKGLNRQKTFVLTFIVQKQSVCVCGGEGVDEQLEKYVLLWRYV